MQLLSTQGEKTNKTFPGEGDRRKCFKQSRDHGKIKEAREHTVWSGKSVEFGSKEV